MTDFMAVRAALGKARMGYGSGAEAQRIIEMQNPRLSEIMRAERCVNAMRRRLNEAADMIERPGLGAQIAARFRKDAEAATEKEDELGKKVSGGLNFIERRVVAPHLNGVTFLGTFRGPKLED